MALKSLIFDNKGNCFLNSLKRWSLSGILVPQQNLTVAKMPAASSLTQPGRSTPIPLHGPADASTEVYSFSGRQEVTNQGIGIISTNEFSAAVTGVGTRFLSQVLPGDTISAVGFSGTVLAVNSDTSITLTAVAGASVNLPFFDVTPNSRDFGDNIFVKIQDQAWRRYLMNRDVPAIHVFGDNTKPLFLKESSLLETDQALVFEFFNYDTANPASFAPIAEGRKWQYEALKAQKVFDFIRGLRERKEFIQPYWLTLDKGSSSLGTGASSTEFLTCTGDITLVLFNLYAQAFGTSGAGGDVSNVVTAQLLDAKTQRAIQTQPMPLTCIGGTAQNPMRLPTPWIVEPQTQIRVNFQNNSGAPCKVYLTFHGVAIYTGSSWHGSTLTNKRLKEESELMYRAMSEPQIIPAEAQG